MANIFHTFEIGDGKKIQIERISAGETLSLFFKVAQIWNKGGEIHSLLEHSILKNLKINNVDATCEELEIYEYIDLFYEAISLQFDFESLGKSKAIKALGIDISSIKEKMIQKLNEEPQESLE